MGRSSETLARARAAIRELIEANLDDFVDIADEDLELPSLSDFMLVIAVDDAVDGAGQGRTFYGITSAGYGPYRYLGLAEVAKTALMPVREDS